MKKSKFTDTQIISVLRKVESGMKVEDICRKHGIGSATYYKWKSKFGGMYADVRLENLAMKDLFSKKGLAAVEKKSSVQMLVEYGLSVAKACSLYSLSRSTYYRPKHDCRKAVSCPQDRTAPPVSFKAFSTKFSLKARSQLTN
jgi:putative transposase